MHAHQHQKNAIPRMMNTSWDQEKKMFVFTFSPFFVERLQEYFKAPAGFIKLFLSHHSGWYFDIEHMDQGLGIRKCLTFLGQNEMGYQFGYTITRLWKKSRGTGELVENVDAHEHFGCFCLTLSLFSRIANLIAQEHVVYDELQYIPSNANTDQVVLFELGEEVGNHKAALSAWIHGDIRHLFFEISDKELQMIWSAMRWVYTAISGKVLPKQAFDDVVNSDGDELRFWFELPDDESSFGICFHDQEGNPWEWGTILSSDCVEYRFEQFTYIVALAMMQVMYDRKKRK